jgi:hypothetical protein
MKHANGQLIILVAAAKREAGQVLPQPESLNMNAGAMALVLKNLLMPRELAGFVWTGIGV